MTIVRPPAVAGMFYPAHAAQLMGQVRDCLRQAESHPGLGVPKAVIVPHAGYIYSGVVAASAYALLEPARDTIRRVVLLGPSHHVAFRGMAVSGAGAWATPLGETPLDGEAIARAKAVPRVIELEAAHAREHSLEVHLPFLQTVLGDFQLVPVVVGDAAADAVAALIDALWGGGETLVVVSTDLSHYLDYRGCRELDGRTAAAIERFAPESLEGEQACGLRPLSGLLLAARRRGHSNVTLDLRNSGDTAGPKDRVVGYGAWALFEPEAADEVGETGPLLLELARAAIRHGLTGAGPLPVTIDQSMPAPLRRPGAAFVTLKVDGELRGCVGSPQAWRPLAEDVCDNAYKAAFRDPRFPPLNGPEWERVELSISLLTSPVAMTFTDQADLLAQLRPGIDGLIIEDQGRRALFLPSVWEQLPGKADFLAHLKRKAGLASSHWSPAFQAQRFEAMEIKPEPSP